jgi:hypothetical protein
VTAGSDGVPGVLLHIPILFPCAVRWLLEDRYYPISKKIEKVSNTEAGKRRGSGVPFGVDPVSHVPTRVSADETNVYM